MQKDAYNTQVSKRGVASQRSADRGLDSSIFTLGPPHLLVNGLATCSEGLSGLTALTALHVCPCSCQPLCQTLLSLSVAQPQSLLLKCRSLSSQYSPGLRACPAGFPHQIPTSTSSEGGCTEM